MEEGPVLEKPLKRRAIAVLTAPLAVLVIALLAGCEGVGIPATDDPNVKLSQAEYLRSGSGRIMQARRVTEQAIALFEQRGDKAGLAKAYREYGLIALDGGLNDDPVILRAPNAPRNPRPGDLDTAETNLKRALDFANETDQRYLAANINFVLGNVQVLRGTPQESCSYYDSSIKGFLDAEAHQPGVRLELPAGANDPTELVKRAKKEAGCASAPPA
jgi:hypothetical protein